MKRFSILIITVLVAASGLTATHGQTLKGIKKQMNVQAMKNPSSKSTFTEYRRAKVEDTEILYREAGDPGKPVILLLHGFPSSSHMYRNLITKLGSEYHLIAPDYPGFGMSSSPSPETFSYTFDHLSEIMEKFIDNLKLTSLTFYLQDYGGPIGFRIAKRRPELVKGLIIQNANMYLEGIGPDVQKIGALSAAKDVAGLQAATNFMMSFDGIKEQYLYGASQPNRISPDSYNMDHFFFERPGIKEIQKALFRDYENNFTKYPEWQDYLRKHQPPALLVWGKNDKIFPGAGATAYKKDLPQAEVHLFNGGHFLLEENGEEVAALIQRFLKKIIQQH
ncbi:alpha/beta hydrolase [Pedobacter aquatilis]|uniref:alpha/beta fold hydrolase n=1 Tax=Pedobacter aquatilis TaxID=351343 RepID=UPI0025B3D0EC|nr:alpha/beta hydrolase [Pedobacter aquatilis]MDN3588666.1 alpha/beta hydrolase [Pedobacter aquatilis]